MTVIFYKKKFDKFKNFCENNIFCENKNHETLNQLNLENHIFYPELNSNNVFYQVRMQPERYGLRDRDFLTDAEILKLKKNFKNQPMLNRT